MLYCADWASVLIIDLEWTGGTVHQNLQNTSILNISFRHYDKHNQQIFQALCVFYALKFCRILVLVHIFHVPSKCTQAWWKMKLESIENFDLLELIHNAVETLVMVSSEAWDCSDMDNCIEAFSQSWAVVTREHSSTLLSFLSSAGLIFSKVNFLFSATIQTVRGMMNYNLFCSETYHFQKS